MKKESVYTSVQPLLRVSQILGLAPVTWPRLKPSGLGSAYTCAVFLGFLAWFVYTTCLAVTRDYPGRIATYVVPDLLNSGALYLTSLTSLALGATLMRSKPEAIMRLLMQVDRVVCPSAAHKRAHYVVSLQIGVLVVSLSVLAVFDNWVWTGRLWNLHDYTGRFLAHLVNAVVVLQFSNLALLLRHRFGKLNHRLLLQQDEDMFDDFVPEKHHRATNNVVFEKSSTPVAARPNAPVTVRPIRTSEAEGDDNIFALRRAHALLCEVACMANAMFGAQILLALTSEFIGIIWLLYLTLVSGGSQKTLCLSAFWILFRCAKVLFVVCACHVAQAEALLTGTLVHRVLLHKEALKQQGGRLVQLQRFSQQLMHSRHQVHFSACGLFSLDMTLLHSIASAVTTYIIILMQFHAK